MQQLLQTPFTVPRHVGRVLQVVPRTHRMRRLRKEHDLGVHTEMFSDVLSTVSPLNARFAGVPVTGRFQLNAAVPNVDVQSGDCVIVVAVSVPLVVPVPVTMPSGPCVRAMVMVPLKTRRNWQTLVGLVVGTTVTVTVIWPLTGPEHRG